MLIIFYFSRIVEFSQIVIKAYPSRCSNCTQVRMQAFVLTTKLNCPIVLWHIAAEDNLRKKTPLFGK